MGMSERERKILADLEQQLRAEDFPYVDKTPTPKVAAGYTISGSLLLFAGVIVLLVAVIGRTPWVGLLAFLIMLWGSMRLVYGLTHRPQSQTSTTSSKGFWQALQDRWDDRLQ